MEEKISINMTLGKIMRVLKPNFINLKTKDGSSSATYNDKGQKLSSISVLWKSIKTFWSTNEVSDFIRIHKNDNRWMQPSTIKTLQQ
jgi:hypothetical protein